MKLEIDNFSFDLKMKQSRKQNYFSVCLTHIYQQSNQILGDVSLTDKRRVFIRNQMKCAMYRCLNASPIGYMNIHISQSNVDVKEKDIFSQKVNVEASIVMVSLTRINFN